MISYTSLICGWRWTNEAVPPRSFNCLRVLANTRRPALLTNFRSARFEGDMTSYSVPSTGTNCCFNSGAVEVSRLPVIATVDRGDAFVLVAPFRIWMSSGILLFEFEIFDLCSGNLMCSDFGKALDQQQNIFGPLASIQ